MRLSNALRVGLSIALPNEYKYEGVPMASSVRSFRSSIACSPDAVSLIDSEGQILCGSESTVKLFGYPPAQFVGRNCFDLMHPEDRDQASRALKAVLTDPADPLRCNLRVRTGDGSYCWVENTFTNLLLSSEVQAIVLHQPDIHAQKVSAFDNQRRAEELTVASRRLEEFSHHLAHDLREPLRTVSLYAQLLLRKTKLDPNAERIAEAIVAGTERMSCLVESLLSLAETGAHEPLQWVDLQSAAADAKQNLATSLEELAATLTMDQLPIVRGDEIQLMRIFQNLIGNALKYRSERPLRILVNSERRGPFWVIRVEDNGIGIAVENQTRIFEPFIRVAGKDVAGAGLGLAVCKKIIEAQGGTIWVESEPGTGSSFCFTIPIFCPV
jgi:PAS domain S-box-containing protein